MTRSVLAPTIAVALAVVAIVTSCSGDAGTSDPIAPTDDGLSIAGGSLSGGGWTPNVERAAAASGKVNICHSGNGKHYSLISVSAEGARAHLGDPESGKGGHDADYRVSDLTPCPPPASAGHIQVCKVADAGVAVGTNFTFTLTTDEGSKLLTVAAGAPPTGNCASAGEYRIGTTINVRETPKADVEAIAITVAPAGAQQGTSNYIEGRATVIAGVGTTTLTFTNRGPTGLLVVCKVAGNGVTAGTNFSFSAAGQTWSVPAGAAPSGTCRSITVGVGPVTVSEAAATGSVVQAITGAPVPTNVNLTERKASTVITKDKESRVVFTNAASATGALVICKVAGAGITTGANFVFTAGGLTQTIAAGAAPNGTCGAPMTLPAGQTTVTETAVTGTSVSAIAIAPIAPLIVNLAGRSATVVINSGQETRLTFTNTAP